MKLNKSKILQILWKKNRGESSYQARKAAGISKRRVDQLWKYYQETGEIPLIGQRLGRPPNSLQDEEIRLVKEVYAEYRVSASTLEPLIKRDHGKHIPHNRIHRILLQEGLATKGEYMPRKKNWIRYERRHSLTAVHIDWHQRPNDGPWVFFVEDDASRALLAGVECASPTTEMSITYMEQALEHGSIRECISDHGSQFTSNNDGESKFSAFLEQKGIKQILCRIKHPQSNGKVEKLFDTYERNRDAFPDLPSFMHWYNQKRPHRSLDYEHLETPWKAFQRKMRAA